MADGQESTTSSTTNQPNDGGDGEALDTTALGGGAPDGADKSEGAEKPAGEGDGAEKPAGDKPEGEEGAEEGAANKPPETYELTAPEGFELDKEALAEATPVFQELGLTNENAQKLMPVAAKFAERIVNRANTELLGKIGEERKAWLETAKADSEIGGANWDKSLAAAAAALDQLGMPKGSPFRNILDESGLGNHPEMIRAFARVKKAIGEDSDFVRPEHNASIEKSDVELFYPQPNGSQ